MLMGSAFKVENLQNGHRSHGKHECLKDFFYAIVMKLHRNDPSDV
jgi:hypothetical protein